MVVVVEFIYQSGGTQRERIAVEHLTGTPTIGDVRSAFLKRFSMSAARDSVAYGWGDQTPMKLSQNGYGDTWAVSFGTRISDGSTITVCLGERKVN